MKFKSFFIVFLSLALSGHLLGGNSEKHGSATRQVMARVVDEKGDGVAGAVIKLKETGETVYTDMDGQFTLTVTRDKAATLEIDYLGYQRREIPAEKIGLAEELSIQQVSEK